MSDNNVVSLFGSKIKKEVKDIMASENDVEEELSFVEIMKRNAENFSRVKKDRARANKGVVRSYRLKR